MPIDSVGCYIDPTVEIVPEIRYTLDLFLSTLGVAHRFVSSLKKIADYAVGIAYLSGEQAALPDQVDGVILRASPEAREFFQGAQPAPAHPSGYLIYKGRRAPILFGAGQDVEGEMLVEQARSRGTVDVPADLVTSAFWFVSRWEESKTEERDEWGRFRYADSLYARLTNGAMHVVDDYLVFWADLLRASMEHRSRRLWWAPMWPKDAPFAVCLTHDIDMLWKWDLRRVIGEAGYLRRAFITGGLPAALRRIGLAAYSLWKDPNPCGRVLSLGEREQQAGVSSTYFFLAGRHHRLDGKYDVSRPGVSALIQGLLAQGHEVGLHGSFTTLGNPARLRAERERLEQVAGPVRGVRQHYLRFDVRVSWGQFAEAGFGYDTSLGFAEQVGSRAGISFPFLPYNVYRRQAVPLVEIPLTIMDATLHSYHLADAQSAWNTIEGVLDRVRVCGGCCTILWHNSTFDELDAPGYGALYWRLLAWARARGAWIAPAGEVARWWLERITASGALLA